MIVLGWVVVVGLPLAVIVGAIYWPERIPPEKSVDGIRARVEAEDRQRNCRHWPGLSSSHRTESIEAAYANTMPSRSEAGPIHVFQRFGTCTSDNK